MNAQLPSRPYFPPRHPFLFLVLGTQVSLCSRLLASPMSLTLPEASLSCLSFPLLCFQPFPLYKVFSLHLNILKDSALKSPFVTLHSLLVTSFSFPEFSATLSERVFTLEAPSLLVYSSTHCGRASTPTVPMELSSGDIP